MFLSLSVTLFFCTCDLYVSSPERFRLSELVTDLVSLKSAGVFAAQLATATMLTVLGGRVDHKLLVDFGLKIESQSLPGVVLKLYLL